jgi:hypothetical protein
MSEKKLSTWRDRSRPQSAPHVLGLSYTREPVGDVIDRRRRATSESPCEPQIGFSVRPATGFIVVGGFLDPRWRVEIEADAIVDD